MQGNALVDDVVKNVSIITATREKDIPIYRGMGEAMVHEKECASGYHGSDGFGGKQVSSSLPLIQPLTWILESLVAQIKS